jgi:predicted transposase/invertase (TIGR01784 family)
MVTDDNEADGALFGEAGEISRRPWVRQERVRYMTYTLKLKEERKIGHEAGFREGMEKGMEKGLEKGLQKGTQKGKLEDALEMLKDGVAVEKIAKYTGLSPDMITALKQ